MTSPQHENAYKDTIQLSTKNDTYLVENEPLYNILNLIYNYEFKGYWNKRYKGYWQIQNNNLFLTQITGSINDKPINLKRFANDINIEIAEMGIFASWYSDKLKILKEQDYVYNDVAEPVYVLDTYLMITIEKGRVVNITEIEEQKDILPF